MNSPSSATTAVSAREASGWRGVMPLLLILGAAFAGLIAVLPYAAGYGPVRHTLFHWLWNNWQDATWQHGMLAFPMAAFLVMRQAPRLEALPTRPSMLGLLLTLFSLALYWAGYRGSFFLVGFASIQLLLAGMVLWVWGWPMFRAVSFAWFIAGFAWPYIFLEDSFAFQLRRFMVAGSSWLLNHIGLATVQDGTRLLSAPTGGRTAGQWFDLNVDVPCSGLRSLFALMMVSALYGYFRQRSFGRRLLIFALSVPLALLANMVRILVLIGATILFGSEFAIGKGESYTSNFHLITGIVVFLVAFAGLMLVEKALNRFGGRQKPLPLWKGNGEQ